MTVEFELIVREGLVTGNVDSHQIAFKKKGAFQSSCYYTCS